MTFIFLSCGQENRSVHRSDGTRGAAERYLAGRPGGSFVAASDEASTQCGLAPSSLWVAEVLIVLGLFKVIFIFPHMDYIKTLI